MSPSGVLTDGQMRLREIVSGHPQDGTLWRELRGKLAADHVVLSDPRTGQSLSAVGANATYARFQAVRWADHVQVVDRWVLDDVDSHAYGRPDHTERLPAALGGAKAHRTMQFLLDQAAGHQPFTHDVGLVVLTGSRMSCEASAEHRALAAFLWGGPLIAEHARIRVIADEPDEELRRACAIIDPYALHPDGFHAVPYGQVADLSRRAGLLALAERLSATPLAQRCIRLDDVEIALSEQMKRDVPLERPAGRRWWRRFK